MDLSILWDLSSIFLNLASFETLTFAMVMNVSMLTVKVICIESYEITTLISRYCRSGGNVRSTFSSLSRLSKRGVPLV
jgi:hypothetical protein